MCDGYSVDFRNISAILALAGSPENVAALFRHPDWRVRRAAADYFIANPQRAEIAKLVKSFVSPAGEIIHADEQVKNSAAVLDEISSLAWGPQSAAQTLYSTVEQYLQVTLIDDGHGNQTVKGQPQRQPALNDFVVTVASAKHPRFHELGSWKKNHTTIGDSDVATFLLKTISLSLEWGLRFAWVPEQNERPTR